MQQHIHNSSSCQFPLLSAEKQHALQKPASALYQETCIDFNSDIQGFILWISNAKGETQHWTDISQRGNKGRQAGRHMHKVASHHKPVLPCHTLERNFRNSARFLDSCGRTEWIVRESLTNSTTHSWNCSGNLTEVIKMSDTARFTHYVETSL